VKRAKVGLLILRQILHRRFPRQRIDSRCIMAPAAPCAIFFANPDTTPHSLDQEQAFSFSQISLC
ncbi:hypothetical protein, partial [Tabrizicola sp.]|uniref:hypothetical protein n=1 Tax=Tabrizicola sp. TaxID=2005166 RepID=UPI0035B192C6